MGVETAEFVSIGSAGLGLFAYLGLIRTLHVTNPKLLEGARGFIGVSAGAFACLCLALELHRNDDFTLIHNAAKRCTVLSNHKVCSFGLSAPNMGKNIACDLKQLANAMLRHGGFHEDVTMAGLQARLQASTISAKRVSTSSIVLPQATEKLCATEALRDCRSTAMAHVLPVNGGTL